MSVPTNFATAGLAELAVRCETLIEAGRLPIDSAIAYTNILSENPEFGRHLLADVYVARTCTVDPVVLWRLADDAVLYGGDEFLVAAGGSLVREQVAPYLADAPSRLQELLTAWRPTIQVAEECLLAARYGVYTWGHWLAELLPRIVLAEARFPGRFRFVLPLRLVTESDADSPMIRIRESLQAYGIDLRRVLPLQPAMNYRFARLYATSPVWSDHIMHPAAAALMRDRIVIPADTAPPANRRIGLMRIGVGRNIANLDEVNALLLARGFTLHTIGTLPFADQVRLFSSASLVFAILGSDLAGLIYAPEGVRLITVAPRVFGDRFFYALLVDRKGRYADLRGPIAELNPAVEHRSSFHIDVAEIGKALDRLG